MIYETISLNTTNRSFTTDVETSLQEYSMHTGLTPKVFYSLLSKTF